MGLLTIAAIGSALAMDAAGVSLSIGLNSKITRQKKYNYVISFAVFQGLFTWLGAAAGSLFDTYITSIPAVIGGIVMCILGIVMILESFKEKENIILEKNSACILLGISVSVDAAVIGFSVLCKIKNVLVLTADSVLIGLITAFFCLLAFYLDRYFRKVKLINKYADFLGGIALIFFGLKLIL